MNVAIVMGTRPEIIKLAPIITKLNSKNKSIIFTGQHFDYEMGLQFIKQLGLPRPDYSMRLSHVSQTDQIGQIIARLSRILKKIEPDSVIVQGDTNTVLAAAISSLKSGIPVTHVEAGLRSFDWRMQEEHNRVVADHISELLFAPTKTSQKNLKLENVHGRIFVTGNTIIDAINQYYKLAKKNSGIFPDVDNFALMTFHRAENVDDKNTLENVIKAIINADENIVFPVHPRTKKRLKEFGLYTKLKESPQIHLLNPIGYFEMLHLMIKCSFIITDSGGIQEEATSPLIRKKVVVLRKFSDRPEAIKERFSILAGLSQTKMSSIIRQVAKNPQVPKKRSPYGSGNAAGRIINSLRRYM